MSRVFICIKDAIVPLGRAETFTNGSIPGTTSVLEEALGAAIFGQCSRSAVHFSL